MRNGTNTSSTPTFAVASSRSATMCVSAAGMTIHGVQSCSARTARFDARKLRSCVRGAIPVRTAMQSATYAASPLARASSQKKRSIYELLVVVTAARVVVRTLDESDVVLCVVAVAVGVLVVPVVVSLTAATTAGCSGALVM